MKYTTTSNFRPWYAGVNKRFPDNQVKHIDNNGRMINLLVKNDISDGEII
jgi:hypothetical protein